MVCAHLGMIFIDIHFPKPETGIHPAPAHPMKKRSVMECVVPGRCNAAIATKAPKVRPIFTGHRSNVPSTYIGRCHKCHPRIYHGLALRFRGANVASPSGRYMPIYADASHPQSPKCPAQDCSRLTASFLPYWQYVFPVESDLYFR